MAKTNPRWAYRTLRQKYQRRYEAEDAPCGICRGRLGRIRYDQPRTPEYPLSLVIDEILPVSKWEQFGYESAKQAAADPNNIQPAHRICNQLKSDKVNFDFDKAVQRQTQRPMLERKQIKLDGNW